MRREDIPELQALPEAERMRVRLAVTLGIFKDPRVWGAYAAQIAGFIAIVFVLFPNVQSRGLLALAYAIPTMMSVRAIQRRVLRERVVAFLASERGEG